MNKKIVHDALILTAFTLVLGLILGLVHEITKAPIEAANLATTQAAYQKVFEDADSFQAVDGFDKDAATETVVAQGYEDSVDDAQEALDASGNVITFSVGIQSDGTVNGYSITSISETPGLGMKAEDEDFYSQFQNKKVDSFEVVKQAPSSDNQIESISGATITSRAMANGVNAALAYFNSDLGGAQ